MQAGDVMRAKAMLSLGLVVAAVAMSMGWGLGFAVGLTVTFFAGLVVTDGWS